MSMQELKGVIQAAELRRIGKAGGHDWRDNVVGETKEEWVVEIAAEERIEMGRREKTMDPLSTMIPV
ncbi:hypothetical protein ACLOJK_009075 [Asimina triloba]